MKQSSSSKKLIVSCDKGSTKPRNTITIHTVPSNLSTLITARNRSWRYWQQTTVGPVWNSYNEMLKPLSRNRDTGNQSRHPRTCPVGGGGGETRIIINMCSRISHLKYRNYSAYNSEDKAEALCQSNPRSPQTQNIALAEDTEHDIYHLERPRNSRWNFHVPGHDGMTRFVHRCAESGI